MPTSAEHVDPAPPISPFISFIPGAGLMLRNCHNCALQVPNATTIKSDSLAQQDQINF